MTPLKLTGNNYEPGSGTFLTTVGSGRKVVAFHKKQTIFAQGDAAGAVFYIRQGKIRHTVVSRFGKEANLDILSEGEFFGYCGLAGRPFRTGTATAKTDCNLLQIEKEAMMLELNRGLSLSELFVAYLLARNIRNQEELVEQIFDPVEMRIARVLLLLADFSKDKKSETQISKVSQETLAEMAGTTRVQVRFFMNKFRKAGFLVHSRSGLQIHRSLLNVVLHELPRPDPASKAPRKR